MMKEPDPPDMIIKFTRQEGGVWIKQLHAIPNKELLERLATRTASPRDAKGCRVTDETSMGLMHAFYTRDGHRWDCVSGWTR